MTPPPTTSPTRHEDKLLKYDGTNKVRVQSWLKVYALHTVKDTDEERINRLIYHLEGAAFEWFAEEIIGTNIKLWATVSDRMIKRFGTSSAQPLIQAQRLYLKQGESVETYFYY